MGTRNLRLRSFMRGATGLGRCRGCHERPAKYSIQAEVVSSKNCNSGHIIGQTFILDVDGNFITKLCPNKLCVYLISQLTIPVALINERLSEGLEPNDFHFMRYVRCPDTGVDCYGYGEVILNVQVVPRIKEKVIDGKG